MNLRLSKQTHLVHEGGIMWEEAASVLNLKMLLAAAPFRERKLRHPNATAAAFQTK